MLLTFGFSCGLKLLDCHPDLYSSWIGPRVKGQVSKVGGFLRVPRLYQNDVRNQNARKPLTLDKQIDQISHTRI